MTLGELDTHLASGRPVIVCMQAWGTPGEYARDGSGHYVVAVGSDRQRIYFEDPATGKGQRAYLGKREFLCRWRDEDAGGREYVRFGIVFAGRKAASFVEDDQGHEHDRLGQFTKRGSGRAQGAKKKPGKSPGDKGKKKAGKPKEKPRGKPPARQEFSPAARVEDSDLPAGDWGEDVRHVVRRCPACDGKGRTAGEDGKGPARCTLCGGAGKRSILEQRFRDLSPEMAEALKRKTYDTVSAEIYDEPPEGIPGKGKMLRRVAFLGGEVPQVKGLKGPPAPESHAERGGTGRGGLRLVRAVPFAPGRAGASCWACFSEVSKTADAAKNAEGDSMNRDAMVAELSKRGISEDVLKGCPDAALAEWLRSLDSGTDDFAMAIASAANGDEGKELFVIDDNHVGYVAASTNKVFVGYVDQVLSSTSVLVNPTRRLGEPPPGYLGLTALSSSADAVPPHTPATYVITKAGVDAMTLAAPTATTDDGLVITITSDTANAHTLTATGLLNTGAAAVNVATFAAHAGAGLSLMAYQGAWNVMSQIGITFS